MQAQPHSPQTTVTQTVTVSNAVSKSSIVTMLKELAKAKQN